MRQLLFLLIFLFTLPAYAQQDSLRVVAHNNKESVQLKWLPANYELWMAGAKNGYTIERIEVEKTSDRWRVVGKTLLTKEPVMPWSQEKITQEMNSNPALEPLLMLQAGQGLDTKALPPSNAESADLASQKNLVFAMSLFSLATNNKVAEAMGAYYEDNTAAAGKIYLYRVIINKAKTSGEIVVNRNNITKIFPVGGAAANGVHKAINLYWLNQLHAGYLYYNIYRADSKKGQYVKINKLPYIGDIGIKTDDNRFKYTDSVPLFNKKYYYKITGINGFEKESAPTVVLEAQAIYALQQAPTILSAEAPDNEQVTLTWEMPSEEKPHVKYYSIFHSSQPAENFRRINSKILGNDVRIFNDSRKNKLSSNYYTVCAYGSADDSVCSLVKAALLIDSTPPAIPVIISGVCDTNGIVKIVWKKGVEPDLVGYRIFRTYYAHKEAERVTEGHIADTLYVDTIGIGNGFRKIYYRITAIDDHFNPSRLSTFFELKIPDKNPPVNAVFNDYHATQEGIKLSWVKSPSEDLKAQWLYRKSEFEFDWQPIMRRVGDSLQINTLEDKSTKTGLWYEYMLVAEDSAGLRSAGSSVLRILQPEKNPFPVVKNLQGIVSKEKQMVKLSWEFELEATGFRIMRSLEGQPVETYEFVSGTVREFYDKSLTANEKYSYAVVAEIPGNKKSLRSNLVTVKY